MGFFRRIAGLLGFAKDEHHPNDEPEADGKQDPDDQYEDHPRPSRTRMHQHSGIPRKGFSVPVQVVLDRPQHAPLLIPCTSGDGGVQMVITFVLTCVYRIKGLKWYAKCLKMDEDGDVADEFLDEVSPDALAITETHHKSLTFKVKHNTRPAKVKSQVLSPDGRFQQCVEHQGTLQWV